MALELDCDRERAVFGIVWQLLGGALRDRRKRAQFVDQGRGRGFEARVFDTFGRDAPVTSLARRDTLRAHDDVLGAGDADDLLQPRRPAGAGNLAEPLLRQRVLAGFRRDAEIARQRDLETDAEAISAI